MLQDVAWLGLDFACHGMEVDNLEPCLASLEDHATKKHQP